MSRGIGGGSTVPGRIKDLMAAKGMTMRALSDTTGIPYGTLQSYLLGKHTIPVPALSKIAEGLDVSADWLLSRRPAVFDLVALEDALSVLQDFWVFSKNRMPAEESVKMFINLYNKFFLDARRPRPRNRENLEAELTDAKKKRHKRSA